MENLIYQKSPVVTFATNTFINIPVILQYEDTPLISVVKEANLGFTSQFKIYHPDGTDLARVTGTRAYPTEAGKKAGVNVRQLKDGLVCELSGRTVFEIFNQPGDAFRTHAELYTPDGYFVRSAEGVPLNFGRDNEPLVIRGMTMQGNTISGFKIGVLVLKNGDVSLGANR